MEQCFRNRHELQRRLDRDPELSNISVVALDPGVMPTDLVRHYPLIMRVLMFQIVLPVIATIGTSLWPNGTCRTLRKSARDILNAAIECGAPPLSERPKGLFLNGSEAGIYNDEAKDLAKGGMVWRGSIVFAGLDEGEMVLQDWR